MLGASRSAPQSVEPSPWRVPCHARSQLRKLRHEATEREKRGRGLFSFSLLHCSHESPVPRAHRDGGDRAQAQES